MPAQLSPDAVAAAPDVTLAEVLDEAAFLHELAALSPMAYDRRREEAAKLLEVRVSTLDAEVIARRPRHEEVQGMGTPLLFMDLEPWPTVVDGAGLLEDLATLFARYALLPAGGADTLAVWVLHTYCHEAAVISPILCLSSPQKRCGKTTVLSLLRAVVSRALPTSNITAAALFRAIELWRPTLLVDEADSFLRDNEELRGILNSGHTRETAFVIRTVGEAHEPRAFCTWTPKAIALIGAMPATLTDRAIVLPMRRKLPSEQVERLRLDRLGGCVDLQRRCLRWAQDHLGTLTAADPALPVALHDRAADNWRPLVAIAAAAGGAWSARITTAITALTPMTEDDTASVLLLADLQQLFAEKNVEKLLTESILGRLSTLDERPWPAWHKGKPLSARQMATLLRPFGIHSKDLMTDAGTKKGYVLEDCRDAFARYLPAMPRDASHGAGSHETVSAMPRTHIAEANTRNPTSDKEPRGIADTHLGAEAPQDSVPLHAGDACQNPTKPGCTGQLKDIGPGVQCGVCCWAPWGAPVEEEVL
jgi:hypothetical protein